MDYIFTDQASPPKGHYSQAVRHNGILYLSGLLGITSEGEPVRGGMLREAEQVLLNLNEILKAGGSNPNQLLRVTLYIGDMDGWPEVNRLYAAYMGEHRCARSVVPVSNLPFGLHIELEATAACAATDC